MIVRGHNIITFNIYWFFALAGVLTNKKRPLYEEPFFRLMYPEPESNRHVRRHWCLRPTRLPIPPPGLVKCFSIGFGRWAYSFQTRWQRACLPTKAGLPIPPPGHCWIGVQKWIKIFDNTTSWPTKILIDFNEFFWWKSHWFCRKLILRIRPNFGK